MTLVTLRSKDVFLKTIKEIYQEYSENMNDLQFLMHVTTSRLNYVFLGFTLQELLMSTLFEQVSAQT